MFVGGCRAELPPAERLDRILASDDFEIRSERIHGGPQSIRVTSEDGQRVVTYWFEDRRALDPVPYTAAHDSLIRRFVAAGLAEHPDSANWFNGADFELRGDGQSIAFDAPAPVDDLYGAVANYGR